jgi:hypothetical protein
MPRQGPILRDLVGRENLKSSAPIDKSKTGFGYTVLGSVRPCYRRHIGTLWTLWTTPISYREMTRGYIYVCYVTSLPFPAQTHTPNHGNKTDPRDPLSVALRPPFREELFKSLKLVIDSMRFMPHVKFVLQYGK